MKGKGGDGESTFETDEEVGRKTEKTISKSTMMSIEANQSWNVYGQTGGVDAKY